MWKIGETIYFSKLKELRPHNDDTKYNVTFKRELEFFRIRLYTRIQKTFI